MGDGDAAGRLFAMLNPINHSLTPADAARYKVEPYVVAADIYSTAPHIGRGGWTWYTGSAAWMYRAGIEGLLGLTRAGDELVLNPCFPRSWPQVTAAVRINDTSLAITIDNPGQTGRGITEATLDGEPLHPRDGRLTLPLSGRAHRLIVTLGPSTSNPLI
jgi:cyclic beta-1,2-glucan synthetase